MDMDEYQRHALRTQNNRSTYHEQLTNGALGLAGESGEVCDHLKKYLHHGHPLDERHMVKELGDILWYVAVLAHTMGYDLNTVAHANVEKLQRRYENGFSTEASLNRVE